MRNVQRSAQEKRACPDHELQERWNFTAQSAGFFTQSVTTSLPGPGFGVRLSALT
jgi:hypothetical protein